ncbi:hypothetical protein GCM10022251_42710 [Phytohabitans flavus]|uniref:Uncharacterized protein n=2 Tax=Phytohabitans flavus TaxID=1076124 RepID=A0A6F8XZ62_9ACTN|nr:hypothetical protein Pflav_054310 [Phytohabitans flavus]
MATASHVLDAVDLLVPDHRIHVVCTSAPDTSAARADFDLVITGGCGGARRHRGPWLAITPAVMGDLSTPWSAWHDSRRPDALAVPHQDLVHVPQTRPTAAVTGDLCLDRLVRSRPHRAAYRRALGVADGRVLVAVTSTHGPDSLLGRAPAALFDVLGALPRDEFAVVLGLHPSAWYGHLSRPLLAWLERRRRAGLRIVDPATWRGLVCAADVVLGDYGAATVYAAAAGVPVLSAVRLPPGSAPDSPAMALSLAAPVVRPERPLIAYLREAVEAFDPARYESVAAAVTSRPGRAAQSLREQVYRLLRLPEPATDCEALPVGPAMAIPGESLANAA